MGKLGPGPASAPSSWVMENLGPTTAREEAIPQLTTRRTSLAMAPVGARGPKLPIEKQEVVKLPKLGAGVETDSPP